MLLRILQYLMFSKAPGDMELSDIFSFSLCHSFSKHKDYFQTLLLCRKA